MTGSIRNDSQFFYTLRRSAEFLYGQGVADGAAAVDSAARRAEAADSLRDAVAWYFENDDRVPPRIANALRRYEEAR